MQNMQKKQTRTMVNNTNPPILIYQMGKVGSKTIRASLNRINIPTQHVHFLSPDSIRETEDYYQQSPLSYIPEHVRISKAISSFIEGTRGRIRWKIITLVREPLSRTISDVFENIDVELPGIFQEPEERSIGMIIAHIQSLIRDFDQSTDYTCTWFDKELYEIFDFNVLSFEFNKSAGYQIYHAKNADILLLKLELLSKCHKEAFKKFLNISNLHLENANIGTDKPYRHIYKRLLRSIIFTSEDLNKIYASRFVKHFYSADEIKVLKNRWLSGPAKDD